MSTSIKIYQGDSDTLTETITGLTTASGYSAKLYIKTLGGVAIDTITGVVSGLEVEYDITNDSTKVYPIGRHNLESKIFDASDHVYTTSRCEFVVIDPLNNDPS